MNREKKLQNKGFTLVELVVSFTLIMIVVIYLIRTMIVIGNKENELLILEEYVVFETNILDKIYYDIYNEDLINADIISEDADNIINVKLSNIDGTLEENITLNKNDSIIIYDDIIYELPEKVKIDSCNKKTFNLDTNNNSYVINVKFLVNDEIKDLKIIYQY